jgi:hypothetical protein
VSKLWCIITYSSTDKYKRFTFHDDNLDEGIEYLKQFKTWVGHNIVGYDIPALIKLGLISYDAIPNVIDTHVVAKLLYPAPDTLSRNKELYKPIFDSGHENNGLKAWGKRLGVLKGSFGEETDWANPTQEMYDYCEQDVKVNLKLIHTLFKTNRWKKITDAIHTETNQLFLLTKMFLTGVPVAMDKILALKNKMEIDLEQAEKDIP